jgi:hypothetical protein
MQERTGLGAVINIERSQLRDDPIRADPPGAAPVGGRHHALSHGAHDAFPPKRLPASAAETLMNVENSAQQRDYAEALYEAGQVSPLSRHQSEGGLR